MKHFLFYLLILLLCVITWRAKAQVNAPYHRIENIRHLPWYGDTIPKPRYHYFVKVPFYIIQPSLDSVSRFISTEMGKAKTVDQANASIEFIQRQLNRIYQFASVDSIKIIEPKNK